MWPSGLRHSPTPPSWLVLALMLLIYISICTSLPFPNSIHLPPPRLTCVPTKNPTRKGCFKLELTNVHAIPEENRVLLLFSKMVETKKPPPVVYKPSGRWRCIFPGEFPKPIQYIHPHSQHLFCCQYNHVSLAQCELPPSARALLLKDEALRITVTLDNVPFEYTVRRSRRWKRKKLLD